MYTISFEISSLSQKNQDYLGGGKILKCRREDKKGSRLLGARKRERKGVSKERRNHDQNVGNKTIRLEKDAKNNRGRNVNEGDQDVRRIYAFGRVGKAKKQR